MIDTLMPAIPQLIEELKSYAPFDEMLAIVEQEVRDFRDRLERGEPHPTHFEYHI